MKHTVWICCLGVAACMGGGVNTAPVPELATGDVQVRGTDAQAAQLTDADEAEIVTNVVRGFYRTLGGQVRLIDPRPLAHERDPGADGAMLAVQSRAEAFVRVIGLERVCVLGAAVPDCADRGGGILRFSPAYATGRDSAVIFVEYRPLDAGFPGEIEFRMVRRTDGWHMATRRGLERNRENPARAVAERLLSADRAFGTSAGNTDLVSALSAMFDDSVIAQIPGGFADGKVAVIAALRANPDNERSRTMWRPIRAGVSADGLHGFTYGYMTLVRPDSSRVPLKYLAYWVNRGGEWKVLAYKRRPRPNGEVSTTDLAPSLPAVGLSAARDPGIVAAHGSSLAAAEKEFSDTSQVIGIGAAFEKYGRPDAMNMGGPTDTAFVIGNRAIARSVGAGYPAGGSPVSWAADYKAIVASSGDLGVTFGYIRPNETPKAGQPQFFPFFTIWKREAGGPWRYIAE